MKDNIATKDIQKHQDNIESVKLTSPNAEWIQVNNGKKKINLRHKESKENRKCEENNQYGILQEEEDDEDNRITKPVDVKSKVEIVSKKDEESAVRTEDVGDALIREDKVSERLKALESIIQQQQQEITMLQKKNETLEKQVQNMNSESRKKKDTEELKMKTEEDFYNEVIEAKYSNAILADHIELVEKENAVLKEKLQMLEKTSTNYVVEIEPKKNNKNEIKAEQEMINEEITNIFERLIGYNEEVNIELADVLEESDKTINDYVQENEDVKIKLWKAIQQAREINAEMKEKDIELEIVNEENDDLHDKLDVITQELNDLKRKYDKEREDNAKKKNQKERKVVQYDAKNMKKIGRFTYG